MKDAPRPHPSPSSRSAPYRKPKSSGTTSPTRPTRRPNDASRPQGQMASPRAPDRAPVSHRDGAQPICALSSADGDRRSSSGTGGNRVTSHSSTRRQADGSVREWPAHASTLSNHADVPGPSLRLPLSSAAPTITTFASKRREESPSSCPVTAFLRSIELPDKPASAPALQTSFVLAPPSLRLPPVSTQNTNVAAIANDKGYQVSLVYKGYPFTYDLSALPDDPKGMIALLTITKSDPGPYLLVGAHYRRTGRSRAACAVIRSLLDSLDGPSDADKAKGDAASVPASDVFTATLACPGSPRPKPFGRTPPGFKGAAMRPAMLLLAACEMDISRERSNDPESASHVSTAHDLFRAVYGTVNDAIVAGAVHPQADNVLGLDFPRDGNRSISDVNGHSRSGVSPREVEESRARIKHLEKELSTSRAAQKKLQEKLMASNDRLTRAEDKVYALESRSRDMRVQVDASRNENCELRHRLAESEERVRELAQWAPSAESQVWERLKDLLFDNLGGGVRGE